MLGQLPGQKHVGRMRSPIGLDERNVIRIIDRHRTPVAHARRASPLHDAHAPHISRFIGAADARLGRKAGPIVAKLLEHVIAVDWPQVRQRRIARHQPCQLRHLCSLHRRTEQNDQRHFFSQCGGLVQIIGQIAHDDEPAHAVPDKHNGRVVKHTGRLQIALQLVGCLADIKRAASHDVGAETEGISIDLRSQRGIILEQAKETLAMRVRPRTSRAAKDAMHEHDRDFMPGIGPLYPAWILAIHRGRTVARSQHQASSNECQPPMLAAQCDSCSHSCPLSMP
ncbi:hypothetical protein D3C87_620920 [compost metagenome]